MNNQQVSQVMTFYRINFDFHDPYRLILDGNFIKMIVQKELDLKKKLQNAISGGKFKFYVPNCLLRELELLGSDFKFVYEKAKQFRKLGCKHDFSINVDQCIRQNHIGQDNVHKYIVCTQDIELRRDLRYVLNCPLMYFGPDQRIKFQDVNKKSAVLIEQMANKKFLPKENQMESINQHKNQQKIIEKQEAKRRLIKQASMRGVQPKTKITKGPNPLSVKKKTQPLRRPSAQPAHKTVQIAPEKVKRIRKRNRKNKERIPQQTVQQVQQVS